MLNPKFKELVGLPAWVRLEKAETLLAIISQEAWESMLRLSRRDVGFYNGTMSFIRGLSLRLDRVVKGSECPI